MNTGRILIIDDDVDFVRIYRDLLEDLGLDVSVAHTAAEATRVFATSGREIDVILLDQKLQGAGGPDSGLDLLAKIEAEVPLAKTIVVTGYMRPDAIEQAFRLGAYDYIVKNGGFEALVRAKVKNAVEVTRARRLVAADRTELRERWSAARTEPDANRKGRLLEELVQALFRATPGFERVETRLNNGVEEIDIVIENRSSDPTWADAGVYILAECKNWTAKCGRQELAAFASKLENKYRRVKTGIFIAPGGFTEAFKDALRERKLGEYLVVAIDAEDLERWIDADDRVAVLNDLHKRAVFA
ncbi:MAG: response regulator [Deltaproteobacteria bacterium]|nr:response regulator [Deltaproteobacteria bacterium]